MITGTLNANREPIIQISVIDANGQPQERTAIVDTGFNGWLTLPSDFIVALGLRWKSLGTAILADGTSTFFDVYEAKVLWDGQIITIFIDESDSEPLIGISLMYGYELFLAIIDGGTLTLKKI